MRSPKPTTTLVFVQSNFADAVPYYGHAASCQFCWLCCFWQKLNLNVKVIHGSGCRRSTRRNRWQQWNWRTLFVESPRISSRTYARASCATLAKNMRAVAPPPPGWSGSRFLPVSDMNNALKCMQHGVHLISRARHITPRFYTRHNKERCYFVPCTISISKSFGQCSVWLYKYICCEFLRWYTHLQEKTRSWSFEEDSVGIE